MLHQKVFLKWFRNTAVCSSDICSPVCTRESLVMRMYIYILIYVFIQVNDWPIIRFCRIHSAIACVHAKILALDHIHWYIHIKNIYICILMCKCQFVCLCRCCWSDWWAVQHKCLPYCVGLCFLRWRESWCECKCTCTYIYICIRTHNYFSHIHMLHEKVFLK